MAHGEKGFKEPMWDVITLASVSKSVALIWLKIGELGLLAFSLLVVAGLIGESVKRWLAWHRVFAILVIVGVAGELFADGAIFLSSSRLEILQETENANLRKKTADALERAANAELALAKFRAPRTLSSEQQAKITGEMKQFSGTPFVFGVFQEPEALALLTQVDDILIAAGWVEQEWKSGGDVVYAHQGRPNIGNTFVTGVYVQADNSYAADFGPIVAKLALLLSDAGIDAKPEVGRMAPNTNNDAIKILVGQKPR